MEKNIITEDLVKQFRVDKDLFLVNKNNELTDNEIKTIIKSVQRILKDN